MYGERIKTLEDLWRAAEDHQSCIERGKCPKPAAFYLRRQGGDLLRIFTTGLYVYVPPPKKESSLEVRSKMRKKPTGKCGNCELAIKLLDKIETLWNF